MCEIIPHLNRSNGNKDTWYFGMLVYLAYEPISETLIIPVTSYLLMKDTTSNTRLQSHLQNEDKYCYSPLKLQPGTTNSKATRKKLFVQVTIKTWNQAESAHEKSLAPRVPATESCRQFSYILLTVSQLEKWLDGYVTKQPRKRMKRNDTWIKMVYGWGTLVRRYGWCLD